MFFFCISNFYVFSAFIFHSTYYVCMGISYTKSKDQLGKVANLARGQLDKENHVPCPRSRLRIWSCDTGSAVPSCVSLLISILRLNLMLTYRIPSEFRDSISSF